jgi:transcriptional regulator with XRE-family HTH domain
MTFGEKMAYSRKQKKLSQNQLGKLSGVSGDIVGKYERDEMKPSIETAKKLAKGLGVSLDYLAGDSDLALLDSETVRRMGDIEKLPPELKEKAFFFLDMLIRDFKTQQNYAP